MLNVNIKLLREDAVIPKYATEGSAACDLINASGKEITINPKERIAVPSGIAIDFERPDVVALVFPRSGLSSKHGLSLANSVGVIDSDYRGEILVSIINNGTEPYTIAPKERIAQLMFVPVFQANFTQVDELTQTERGAGGFGSTGNK